MMFVRATAALVLAGLTIGPPVAGQEQTLLSGELRSGGWGGPVVLFSSVDGDLATMVGARGAWLINSTIGLGGAGYGLTRTVPVSGGPAAGIDFGYGGIDVEYIHSSDKLVHATIHVLFAGAEITSPNSGAADGVFVLQPQGNVDINITGFMRIAAGGGYRWVTDVSTPGLSNAMFSSIFGALTLKFGAF